jgi:hypothetical protein
MSMHDASPNNFSVFASYDKEFNCAWGNSRSALEVKEVTQKGSLTYHEF